MKLLRVTLLLLLLSCQKKGDSFQFPPQEVNVMPLIKQPVVQTFELTCKVFNNHTIPVSFPAFGTLSYIASNNVVKKGEVLAKLDVRDLEADYNSLSKELDLQKTKLNKFLKLRDIGAVSEIELLTQRTLVTKLENDMQKIGKLINDRVFIAPSDGRVGPWKKKPGEVVAQNEEITFFHSSQANYLDCDLPSNYYDLYKNGQIRFTYNQRLLAVASVSQTVSHTDLFTVRLDFPFDYPNNFAVSTVVSITEPRKGYVVPLEAIKFEIGGNKVFVVHSEGDGFVVKSALVQIKKFLGESVEITHSLEDGALIVSRGVQKLFDNAPVKFEFQGT